MAARQEAMAAGAAPEAAPVAMSVWLMCDAVAKATGRLAREPGRALPGRSCLNAGA